MGHLIVLIFSLPLPPEISKSYHFLQKSKCPLPPALDTFYDIADNNMI